MVGIRNRIDEKNWKQGCKIHAYLTICSILAAGAGGLIWAVLQCFGLLRGLEWLAAFAGMGVIAAFLFVFFQSVEHEFRSRA